MFSELPPMIPSFLVLNIPMNLLQSRNRVRQRAPRFREFHLHSTKRNSSSLVGARWDIRFRRQLGEIYQDNLQRREENLNKRCHSKDGVAFFVLEISRYAQRRFPGYSHRQLRGFRREEHTAAHVLCLSESVGQVAQNMSKKACETNRKRSMSVGIAGEAVSCTSKNTKNQLQSTNKICYYLSYEHKCISDANTGGQIRQWKRKPHTLF